MKKRAFITGATGFVGGALSTQLAAQGWEQVALVRSQSNCAQLEKLGVTLVEGDLCKPESLAEALQGCDRVFHCAALTGVGYSINDFHQVIAEGTQNLITAATAAHVKRFVYVSSILAYEVNETEKYYDESKPLLSTSIDPYGRAKVQAETSCLDAHRRGDISTSIVRPVFIYGPGDRQGGFLPELATMIKNGKFKLVNGGKNHIPLIYISDLIDLLIDCGEQDAAQGQVYNACSKASPRWSELVSELCSQLELKVPGQVNSKLLMSAASLLEFLAKYKLIRSLPVSKAAARLLSHDIEFPANKAEQQLGYKSKIGFEQGIRQCTPMLREILNT